MDKMRNILFTLLSAALFAACTQDEPADRRGEPLPEGQYPLELTASIFGAEATPSGISTRATTDGTWKTGDKIYMQVASKDEYGDESRVNWTNIPILCYTVGSDGKSLAFDPDNQRPQPYWTSTGDQKFIRAWYRGDGSKDLPGDYSVQEDQSSGDNYEKSDFLYAHATIGFRDQTKKLTFYHQLAKVVVNIRKSEEVKFDIRTVEAIVIKTGNFTLLPVESSYGSWNSNTTERNIKLKNVQPANKADFGSGEEDALASYEAIVIPQTIDNYTSQDLFSIIVDGYNNDFYYERPDTAITWKPGHVYTYNITITPTGLQVKVSEDGMTWGNGTSGSGTVTI